MIVSAVMLGLTKCATEPFSATTPYLSVSRPCATPGSAVKQSPLPCACMPAVPFFRKLAKTTGFTRACRNRRRIMRVPFQPTHISFTNQNSRSRKTNSHVPVKPQGRYARAYFSTNSILRKCTSGHTLGQKGSIKLSLKRFCRQNWSTAQNIWKVGRVKDYIKRIRW